MILSKEFFPFYNKNPDIAYFDNASTTHIHELVLEAMTDYYTTSGASPGRGSYPECDNAEKLINNSLDAIASLIGTTSEHIIVTTGATQGLNWIADWHRDVDTVVLCEHDHHSNILPYLKQGRTVENNKLAVLGTDIFGMVDYHEASALFEHLHNTNQTFLFVFTAVSNVTGFRQDPKMLNLVKDYGGLVVCDASQYIANNFVDMSISPNIDYLVYSGHKMYGPTGTGVLYSKTPVMNLMPHYLGGGSADFVDHSEYSLSDSELLHYAGTPNTAGIVGLGKAHEIIDYAGIDEISLANNNIRTRLFDLGLWSFSELMPVGCTNGYDETIFSFYPVGFSATDLSELLYGKGISIRTGELCAQPYVRNTFDSGLVRISIAPYNTIQDCEKLMKELTEAIHKLT